MQPHHIRKLIPTRPLQKQHAPDPAMHADFHRHPVGHPLRKAAALAFVKALLANNPNVTSADVLAKVDQAQDDLRKTLNR